MFGSNDFNQQTNNDPAMLDNVKQLAYEPVDNISPSYSTPAPSSQPTSQAQHVIVDITSDDHRADPAVGFSSSPVAGYKASTPASIPVNDTDDDQAASEPQQPTKSVSNDSKSTTVASPLSQAPDQNHLANLKQQALEHLEPLADHVGGTPEEIFKTTMMIIQNNDNHTLLEKALGAAKNIEDDKIRAKAMLDVINEINYFSQENTSE
jgi:hypothetical protein